MPADPQADEEDIDGAPPPDSDDEDETATRRPPAAFGDEDDLPSDEEEEDAGPSKQQQQPPPQQVAATLAAESPIPTGAEPASGSEVETPSTAGDGAASSAAAADQEADAAKRQADQSAAATKLQAIQRGNCTRRAAGLSAPAAATAEASASTSALPTLDEEELLPLDDEGEPAPSKRPIDPDDELPPSSDEEGDAPRPRSAAVEGDDDLPEEELEADAGRAGVDPETSVGVTAAAAIVEAPADNDMAADGIPPVDDDDDAPPEDDDDAPTDDEEQAGQAQSAMKVPADDDDSPPDDDDEAPPDEDDDDVPPDDDDTPPDDDDAPPDDDDAPSDDDEVPPDDDEVPPDDDDTPPDDDDAPPDDDDLPPSDDDEVPSSEDEGESAFMMSPPEAEGAEGDLELTEAEEQEVQTALGVDEDGDGVADVVMPIILTWEADGDGYSTDSLHADKLGLFEPQPGLVNGRPTFANYMNDDLRIWWSVNRWWLGVRSEMGRSRGWLKVRGTDATPPERGWQVYGRGGRASLSPDGRASVSPDRRTSASPEWRNPRGSPQQRSPNRRRSKSPCERGWEPMEGMSAQAVDARRLSVIYALGKQDEATAYFSAGTREVRIDRPDGAALGMRIMSEKELDKRRLWGLAEVRLPDKTGSGAFPHRPVVAWLNPGSRALEAGFVLDDVVLAIDEHVHPSSTEFGELVKTGGTTIFLVRPMERLLRVASLRRYSPLNKLASPPSKPGSRMTRRTDVLSELTLPPTSPLTSSFTNLPQSGTAIVWIPVPKTPTSGVPLTARGMKSSMQLHKELKDVGGTISKMTVRVQQTLAVIRGTRQELLASVESCGKSLEQNPSLNVLPTGPEAIAAAADEVREDLVKETLTMRFGREPTESALKAEVKLEVGKLAKRRAEVNAPVLEAMAELEEIAALGADTLGRHEEKLLGFLESLPGQAMELSAHFCAREQVVNTIDRANANHLEDHATHECLRLAAETEDSARFAINQALKDMRKERSIVEVCKADLQRAVQEKFRLMAKHRADDLRGTTFIGWNAEELKNMTSRSRLL